MQNNSHPFPTPPVDGAGGRPQEVDARVGAAGHKAGGQQPGCVNRHKLTFTPIPIAPLPPFFSPLTTHPPPPLHTGTIRGQLALQQAQLDQARRMVLTSGPVTQRSLATLNALGSLAQTVVPQAVASIKGT